MKSTLLILLFLLPGFYSSAQNDLPNSYVNVGLGLGMPYGGIGTKTVIGYRNSGVMLGLGYMPGGMLGYEIGAQISAKSFYFNIGYGVSGTYQVNDEPVESIKCGNFMVGYMVNLNKPKNLFLDLGVGHTLGAPTVQLGPFEENQGAFTFAIGVGGRFGNTKTE